MPSACGDADDGGTAALDACNDLFYQSQIGRGHTVFRVAGVDMNNRRARLIGTDGVIGNLLRGDGQIWRHGGGVNASRDRRGENDFFFHKYLYLLCFVYTFIYFLMRKCNRKNIVYYFFGLVNSGLRNSGLG